VRASLASGSSDAVLTDSREAPLWRQGIPGVRETGPLTRDFKAVLISPVQAELAADIDRWLLEAESSGRLAALRRRHLGANLPRTAEPVVALVAAIERRLSLMPYVADAKRRRGLPIEVPEREARVIEAAQQAVLRIARARGFLAPQPEVVRSFFEAQIAAAKEIQRDALAEIASPTLREPADLEQELRPALIRIGDQIARLIVELPKGLNDRSRARALEQTTQSLERLGLSTASTRRITHALGELLNPSSVDARSAGRPLARASRYLEEASSRRRLRAEPALNHSICSSLSVWSTVNESSVPSS